MPVHDWSKVDAGTFHAFHNAWNTHLMGRLNGGILPRGYYALAEQVVRGLVPDVPEMPLFLDDDTYIYVPVEATYQAAFLDLPDFWRDVLEGKQPTI